MQINFLLVLLFTINASTSHWLGNFDQAKAEASITHKLIFINFSGSDWCGPCIRLRKEILESPVFDSYASEHLVLVRADFPRQKKNLPDKEQVQRNELLADKYNAEGKFPYSLLVNEQGIVLKTWDGYPNQTPQEFLSDIKKFSHILP